MMNLNQDLERNKMNTKNIISFNLINMILIYLVLCIGTTLFLSIPLGIIFTIISLSHLIILNIYKKKLKNFKKDEQLSE